ncbi:hypothetical protein FisN_2Hh379 [Fistulifera solaris]|uniref:Uncharacterized protein n=1 Tax=Fistulifera solaris TaxID=1519565 RepID=A0A1Z5KL65_FISSO|nr:hypothetical protein FisN_2Hh379 [Fistulifera solaris]|eukprot:GAX26678.1 hypothetical protein FisN_2Hh379 [Fistulifera solaris]
MMRKKTIRAPLSGGTRRSLTATKRRPIFHSVIITLGLLGCVGLFWTLIDHDEAVIIRPGGKTSAMTQLEELHQEIVSQSTQQEHPTASSWETVQALRNEFYRRYGGREDSEDMFRRGVQAYGSVQATARRILTAAAQQTPFVLSFAGYSVTVGRGNYYHQSYPFILGNLLEPILQKLFQTKVTVRNSAIGGIPSFPYGFCFEHFLGSDPHVISWDFSMNEGRGAAVLESYLRQSQHQLKQQKPMVILLDTDPKRCSLVQAYAEQGLISDAMCVGMAKHAVQDATLLDATKDDSQKPPGFRNWQEFGAPSKCPGRGNWHPKKMEHEWLGWMMAMYFAQAVEEAQRIMATDVNWRTNYQSTKSMTSAVATTSFPKPMSKLLNNSDAVNHLLFGHPSETDSNHYVMKELSCRTNFLPATDHDKVLPSIVVSGLSPGITADNIMQQRSDEAYQAGWVMDLSSVERETKIKVEQCGGLGYVDLKTALYGIPESGTLRFWLPISEASSLLHDDHGHTADDTDAQHWFSELILCEANEKRSEHACRLDKDVEYTVGGVKVTAPVMVQGAAEYLKRQTCVHVGIPPGAQITRLSQVQKTDGSSLSSDDKDRLVANPSAQKDNPVGLVVDLNVRANVNRKDGACCISHVVWEQQ